MLGHHSISEQPISAAEGGLLIVTVNDDIGVSDAFQTNPLFLSDAVDIADQAATNYVSFDDNVQIANEEFFSHLIKHVAAADAVYAQDEIDNSIFRSELPVRTITLTPGFEVSREQMTYTSDVDYDGTGIFHRFSRDSRVAYKFTINLPVLTRIQVQSLEAFHNFHRGGRAFFWDGCPWEAVNTLNLIGEGDGARTQFFLPNRNINTSSISVGVFDGTTTSITTAYSLTSVPGIVTFDTAPDSGDDVLAAHAHRYQCVFDPNGVKFTTWALGVYRAELVLREILP